MAVSLELVWQLHFPKKKWTNFPWKMKIPWKNLVAKLAPILFLYVLHYIINIK